MAETVPADDGREADQSSVLAINLDDPTVQLGVGSALVGGGDAEGPRLENSFGRYRTFLPLGAGGVATVRSCFDPHLGRQVAIKALHPHLQGRAAERARFVREARVMAQLEHPNIVPVHELGVADDGSVYFTMKRVRGVTLAQVLRLLGDGEPETTRHYTLPRLLDIFMHVCEAVTFAHSRGVVHRDLKPSNVLLGDFGEILVMDWGLAKILDTADPRAPADLGPDAASGAARSATATVDGAVSGTPVYMAPEQAAGRVSLISGQADVYSLGAILYEMLTLERMIPDESVEAALQAAISGPVVPPRRRQPERGIPRELDAICMKAVARDLPVRYPSAQALLDDLTAYLSGHSVSAYAGTPWHRVWKWCRRHRTWSSAAAAAIVMLAVASSSYLLARQIRYRTLLAAAELSRERGLELGREKRAVLAALSEIRRGSVGKTVSPEESALAGRLQALEQEDENRHQTSVMLYLQASPGLSRERVRDRLTEIHQERLAYALARPNFAEAGRILSLLRQWLGPQYERAAPELRQGLLAAQGRLLGDRKLSVVTEPAGVPVTLFEVREDRSGRVVPCNPRPLGVSPVTPCEVPLGSYLLTCDFADAAPVRYPLLIERSRDEHVAVRSPGAVPAGMVYVPAGPFYRGGDGSAQYRLHRHELPGFLIKEHEVTFAEFIAFWLADDGGRRRADYVARQHVRSEGHEVVELWDAAGAVRAPYRPELPVVGLEIEAAHAYCEWLGRRGRPVRLPTAAEWEKAARGVDGRRYPWGNAFDAGFALTAENDEGRARFSPSAPPGSFATDCSVYGVLDMAGNVREWTASRTEDGAPFYEVKGGSAQVTRRFVECAAGSEARFGLEDLGFRYVMPLDGAR